MQRAALADRQAARRPPVDPSHRARPTPAEARQAAARARAAGRAGDRARGAGGAGTVLAPRRRAARAADGGRGGAPRRAALRARGDVPRPRPRRSPRAAIWRRRRGSIRRAASADPGARGGGGRGRRLLESDRRPRRGARGVRAGGARWAASRLARRRRDPGAADSGRTLPPTSSLGARRPDAVGARSCRWRRRSRRYWTTARARSRWAELLLEEDPTSPDVLELVALIFGRAGRFGGTERMLTELTFTRPTARPGLARGPHLGAARARARGLRAVDPRRPLARRADDPLWLKAISCARRTRAPGLAGDPRLRPRPRPPRAARGPGGRARWDAAAAQRRRGNPGRLAFGLAPTAGQEGATVSGQVLPGRSSKATSFARSASNSVAAGRLVGQVVFSPGSA